MYGELYTLPPSWGEAIRGWTEWLVAAGASPETIRVRRGIVRSVARQLVDIGHPGGVTTEHLVDLCSRHRWSNDHRRGVRAALIGFYDWFQVSGASTDNPARGLPRVPESTPKPRPAPDTIWRQLLATAAPRERLMARLAAEAGLRRAEVSRVHLDDLTADLLGWSLIVRGKGDKQRIVPITDALASAIRSYRPTGGWLFPGNTDGHISPVRVGMLVSALMPPGWSIHKLRHRYASRGFAGTGNLRAVQEALGHASVATTQRYVAVTSREVRAVSESAA